jgi:hypothetical protein
MHIVCAIWLYNIRLSLIYRTLLKTIVESRAPIYARRDLLQQIEIREVPKFVWKWSREWIESQAPFKKKE